MTCSSLSVNLIRSSLSDWSKLQIHVAQARNALLGTLPKLVRADVWPQFKARCSTCIEIMACINTFHVLPRT